MKNSPYLMSFILSQYLGKKLRQPESQPSDCLSCRNIKGCSCNCILCCPRRWIQMQRMLISVLIPCLLEWRVEVPLQSLPVFNRFLPSIIWQITRYVFILWSRWFAWNDHWWTHPILAMFKFVLRVWRYLACFSLAVSFQTLGCAPLLLPPSHFPLSRLSKMKFSLLVGPTEVTDIIFFKLKAQAGKKQTKNFLHFVHFFWWQ